MTRSKKVTYENLRLRDKSFTDKVLKEFYQEQLTSSASANSSNKNALPEVLEGNQLRAQTNAAIPNAKLVFTRTIMLLQVP